MRSPDQKLGRRSRTSMTSDAEEIDPSHQQLNYIPLQCFFVGSFDTLRWRVLGGTWVFSTVQNASIIGFKWSFVNAAWLLEYSNLHCIQSSFSKDIQFASWHSGMQRPHLYWKEMSWFIQQYFAFWPSWSCRFWGLLVCCSFAKRAIRAAWMFTRVLAILVSYQTSTYLGKKQKGVTQAKPQLQRIWQTVF